MNLTKEQIQFIDQYLKKSEVVFDDLRMELVDHTASAVAHKMLEEDIDFYDAFKNYMVENKRSILKAGMVHHTFNFTLAISKFARFLFSKEVTIFSILFLFLGLKPLKFRLMQDLENLQIILISSVCIFAIIWWIVLYGFFKKRIFALENNLILMTIGYQVVNVSRFFWSESIENEFYVTLISGLLSVLFLTFMLKISIHFYSKNKNLYAAD